MSQNNYAAVNINEQQGWQCYWTFTDIPKTERLEEQWTCFNENYLRNHNFAYYLLKQRMARSLRFKMQSDKNHGLLKKTHLKQSLNKNFKRTLENSK